MNDIKRQVALHLQMLLTEMEIEDYTTIEQVKCAINNRIEELEGTEK